MLAAVRKFKSFIPLTSRGFCFLFALPISLVLGLGSFDVILTLIGLSLFPILILIVLANVRTAHSLKRKAILQFRGPAFGELTEAQKVARCALTAHNCSFLPLFTVKTEVYLKQGLVKAPPAVLSARVSGDFIIEPSLVFPHRGEWLIEHAIMEIEDVLGLTRTRWLHSLQSAAKLTVHPYSPEPLHYPLIPTSFRAGDEAISDSRRDGEPFDLKRYHPSDGLKRIVWKVFARTGDLVARHPEHAMTPEGKSCVFVCAERADDVVCSAALDYARQLEEAGCELYAGCLGMKEGFPATSEQSLSDLLIDSVWDANLNKAREDLETFFESIDAQHLFSTTLIIMISRRLLTRRESYNHVLGCAEFLSSQHVNPAFFVVPEPEKLLSARSNISTPNGNHTPGVQVLQRWFLDQHELPQKEDRTKLLSLEKQFREECLQRNWLLEEQRR